MSTPNTNAMPFVSTGMIPTFGNPPNMMMQPHFNPTVYPPGGMGNIMYPPQKFNAGYSFPPQFNPYQTPTYVDPTQPTFNLGYPQQHGPRQSGPPHKSFKGNKN